MVARASSRGDMIAVRRQQHRMREFFTSPDPFVDHVYEDLYVRATADEAKGQAVRLRRIDDETIELLGVDKDEMLKLGALLEKGGYRLVRKLLKRPSAEQLQAFLEQGPDQEQRRLFGLALGERPEEPEGMDDEDG